MLIVPSFTKVKVEIGVNFWIQMSLDETNWNKELNGRHIKHKVADENTFLIVQDVCNLNGRYLYKVITDEGEEGWVNDAIIICSLYGNDFYWDIYDTHILKNVKYTSSSKQTNS